MKNLFIVDVFRDIFEGVFGIYFRVFSEVSKFLWYFFKNYHHHPPRLPFPPPPLLHLPPPFGSTPHCSPFRGKGGEGKEGGKKEEGGEERGGKKRRKREGVVKGDDGSGG